jgi:hypothetical protein
MKLDKILAVGLFLVLFVSFLVLAYVTIFHRECMLPSTSSKEEGFQVAPTRASDCRCLNGYIPSNMLNSKYGGDFITNGGLIAFQPAGTKTKHLISNCLTCEGINPCNQKKKMLTKSQWDSIPWNSQQYSCSLFTQSKKNAKKTSETYFCQHLRDSEKTRSCY